MDLLAQLIYRFRKRIPLIFAVLTVISTVLFFLTPVNYNLMDYLPSEANSTKALSIMAEEFEQPIPNLNVMVKNVSLVQAENIKERLKASPYVVEVLWLDDIIDLKLPLETQDGAQVEAYYKNKTALYTVTIRDGEERAAIASVREAVGMDSYISGTAADRASAQEMAFAEASGAMMLIVPIMVVILIISTTSWVEPLVYLMTMAAAILINLGTCYFSGEISFLTLAAAPILQLAVSLDYAVFFSDTYAHHRAEGKEPERAMRLAVIESAKSISASMLTTLFGFVALTFMEFRLGADMGISLVKGVIISFLTVLTLLPTLLLSFEELMNKTKHRCLFPSFKLLSRLMVKVRIPVMLLLVIIIIPCTMAQSKNSFFYGNYETVPEDSEDYLIQQEFGFTNNFVLMVPRESSAKETALCDELSRLPQVSSVVSYASMVSNKIPVAFLDESITGQFYSEDYARIILFANCAYEGQESFEFVEKVRALAEEYYPGEWYTCGQSANMYDIKTIVQTDNTRVNIITVVSIFLVLLFMTGNLILPILLIFTIKCASWINMSVPYFAGNNLSYVGYLLVSTIQMGATVDYAILVQNTYNEKRLGMDKTAAMVETLSRSLPSVLVSAGTMSMAGLALNVSSSNPIVQVLGVLIFRGTLLSLMMVLLLLPALLLLLDGLVPHLQINRNRARE